MAVRHGSRKWHGWIGVTLLALPRPILCPWEWEISIKGEGNSNKVSIWNLYIRVKRTTSQLPWSLQWSVILKKQKITSQDSGKKSIPLKFWKGFLLCKRKLSSWNQHDRILTPEDKLPGILARSGSGNYRSFLIKINKGNAVLVKLTWITDQSFSYLRKTPHVSGSLRTGSYTTYFISYSVLMWLYFFISWKWCSGVVKNSCSS